MKSAGVLTKLTASQNRSSTTKTIPIHDDALSLGMRAPSDGAEASAATVRATLTPLGEKVPLDGEKTLSARFRGYDRAVAEVAELADAPDSKSGAPRGVWVRFPPSAWTAACGRRRQPVSCDGKITVGTSTSVGSIPRRVTSTTVARSEAIGTESST